jgi:hypothetical protein
MKRERVAQFRGSLLSAIVNRQSAMDPETHSLAIHNYFNIHLTRHGLLTELPETEQLNN